MSGRFLNEPNIKENDVISFTRKETKLSHTFFSSQHFFDDLIVAEVVNGFDRWFVLWVNHPAMIQCDLEQVEHYAFTSEFKVHHACE